MASTQSNTKSTEVIDMASSSVEGAGRGEGRKRKYEFPFKLYTILQDMERKGCKDVISWLPDGRAFRIHDVETFANHVLPKYCNGIQYKSFIRNINLYCFERIRDRKDPDVGAYFHPMFKRDEEEQCLKMVRPKRPRKDGRKPRAKQNSTRQVFQLKSSSTGSLPREVQSMKVQFLAKNSMQMMKNSEFPASFAAPRTIGTIAPARFKQVGHALTREAPSCFTNRFEHPLPSQLLGHICPLGNNRPNLIEESPNFLPTSSSEGDLSSSTKRPNMQFRENPPQKPHDWGSRFHLNELSRGSNLLAANRSKDVQVPSQHNNGLSSEIENPLASSAADSQWMVDAVANYDLWESLDNGAGDFEAQDSMQQTNQQVQDHSLAAPLTKTDEEQRNAYILREKQKAMKESEFLGTLDDDMDSNISVLEFEVDGGDELSMEHTDDEAIEPDFFRSVLPEVRAWN
mmetsp:Transcript_79768/g.231540  ORF Transcript_79768/g.231540 Transcript_79768/m.231540 type:complete len:457 (-) Transcript_79768:319-1689(-)|eukprot:CAMPEP_0176011156 /NCGR_PEP_ID=MMETSP0120_2-20121206/5140_1 /TAXON_ID=160619 /ORGANISM="Kryptoperidinium foliaceum, Strain CCMP 1326" /LENGTH=456 /DNA_ID=CAMNT_0017344013 /DNA_START=87 /DNA_END=1457 /DNA_ORIENTATION=-